MPATSCSKSRPLSKKEKGSFFFIFICLLMLYWPPSLIAAICIDLPVDATPLEGGTYTGAQMFRIDANDGDSLRVSIPNGTSIYMILYVQMSSTQACEILRGNNAGDGTTKALEYTFPYNNTWYLEVFGIGTFGGFQLQVSSPVGGPVDCDKYCEESG